MKNKVIIYTIIVLIFIVAFVFVFKNNILKMIYPKKYGEAVEIYKEKYNVEENLIYALIKAESNFEKDAVSNSGALGLMQLMEETALDVAKKENIELDEKNTKENLFDIYKNIEIGTCYLATLLKKYQNKEVALAAYNAGTGTVDEWIRSEVIKADGSDIEKIPYKETNNYVRRILRDYKIYQDLYKN